MLRLVYLFPNCVQPQSLVPKSPVRRLLKSSEAMRWLNYDNPMAFLRFVRSAGVPHIRLNARRIMFDEAQLNDWLARRTVGGKRNAV